MEMRIDMRKLLFATATLLAMSTASNAAVIANLGPDPTSSTGLFNQPNASGSFDDQVLFSLSNPTQNFVIAGVQNVFAQPTDFISGFSAAVYNYGANGIFEGTAVGNGDDFAVIGPTGPSPCQFLPNCQIIAGSANLAGGLYYVEINGTGGTTAGYNGGVATVAVPGPRAGSFTISSLIDLFK